MTFDIQKILQSKRGFRRELALLPIEDKLRILDALRERQIAIHEGATSGVSPKTKNAPHTNAAHESQNAQG